jgi:hypothetical protein
MAKKVKSETEMAVEVPTTEVFEMLKSTDAKIYSDEFLKEEQIRYNTTANEFGELLKVKKYAIVFDDLKDAKSLLKHIEKNVKWTHADAPLFMAVYQKLKEAVTVGLTEQSTLLLDGPALNGLYQILLKTEGVGYHEVKNYMTLLTLTGEGISNAMRSMVEDQNHLKNIHTNLSVLDDEVNARHLGIQVEEFNQEKVEA